MSLQGSIDETYPPTFCNVPIRVIATLILQVIVAEARYENVDAERAGRLPHMHRNEDGCEHSILRKTKAPMWLVREFVEKFEEANPCLECQIKFEVECSPYKNFFP